MLALDGEDLVAEARPVLDFELEVPQPVSAEQAREAMAAYRGPLDSEFSNCFVCGRQREDALGVFAGRSRIATWSPRPGRRRSGRPTMPAAFARRSSGRCSTARPTSPPTCTTPTRCRRACSRASPGASTRRSLLGEEHVVIAWPLEADGRKHHAGVAVVSAGGDVLARARALLIEPRQG